MKKSTGFVVIYMIKRISRIETVVSTPFYMCHFLTQDPFRVIFISDEEYIVQKGEIKIGMKSIIRLLVGRNLMVIILISTGLIEVENRFS